MAAPALPGVTPSFTELPGSPFAVAVPAAADCAFVSLPRDERTGLAALTPDAPWRVDRVTWFDDGAIPRGMAMDRAGRRLLLANDPGELLILDPARVRSGEGDAILTRASTGGQASMHVVLDATERFAFVTNENSATVSVLDFHDSLGSNAPHAVLLGQVPVPPGPVGLVLAPDGAHLFLTSQHDAEGGQPGVLSALPVADAVQDPERARVTSAAVGHSPVRVALAPGGDVAWVTARGGNRLVAVDTERLIAGRGQAVRAQVRVGAAPTGVAVLAGGALVLVANSDRYAGQERPSTLAVVDASAALQGRRALLGTVPAGAWPREAIAHPDGHTALVTNVLSKTLETVDLGTASRLGG